MHNLHSGNMGVKVKTWHPCVVATTVNDDSSRAVVFFCFVTTKTLQMLHTRYSELFPSKFSFIIFISYMAFFINQGILVTASQNSEKKYSYNTTIVVLLTEVVKLFASIILYCKNECFKSLIEAVFKNTKLFILYFIPSLLYCFYNNLAFVNLTLFDPTSYNLLLQFRVVITALFFQVIFKKYLTFRQWISLLMLTVGCMIKHVDSKSNDHSSIDSNVLSQIFSISAMLIIVQTFCSSLAGVYNEYLLKYNGLNVDIYIQNIFMYVDSIICNIVFIIFQNNSSDIFSVSSWKTIFHMPIILIMLNSAVVGIITSFFLKTLNSILKTFASALELVFTAIACYFIFNIPINIYTIISIFIVSVSIIIYSQNPVVNLAKDAKSNEDELSLIESNIE